MTTIKTAAVGTFFLFLSLSLFQTIQLNAQNVGIGTTSPLARFHVADSSVLFIAPGDASLSPGNPPISGSGRRMMWYPDKAAFRTGYIDGTQWDKTNIGYYSFASGYNNMANGGFSTATGGGTNAGGAYSFTANYATITLGLGSAAFGYRTTAKAHGGISFGALNDDADSPDPFTPALSDRIFQIGNGNVNTLAKNNVMTVLRNGNTGFGTTSPTSLLHIRQGSAGGNLPYGPLSVETNSAAYIGILTPDANESGIIFGKNSDNASGGIIYNNAGDLNGLQFRTNGNASRMVITSAGNVGIGTTAAGFPLNFASSLGDKISLWGSSGAHYGLGIQSNLLQIHTDIAASDIAFGYGTSASFNENLRIKGNGVMQFPASLSKKIIFYPGGTGDASIDVFGNELRLASDYNGADITFGYDDRTNGFTEKFRMKANGAMAVNGNAGSSGQVLQSNGGSQSPTWSNPLSELFNNMITVNQTAGFLDDGTSGYVDIPGMANIPFTITSPSKLIVSVESNLFSLPCTLCNYSSGFIQAFIYPVGSSTSTDVFGGQGAPPNGAQINVTNGMHFTPTLSPGNYYFRVAFSYLAGPTIRITASQLNYIIVRQ